MIFRLFINKDCQEEIIANVHKRTPLIDEIERMVLQENMTDQIPGYLDDEIRMLKLNEIECFVVEDERTYAITNNKKKYVVRKRLYELEGSLPDHYIRISKSAIANWNRISRFKVQLSGAVDAVFESGYAECISRRCFAEIKRRYEL